MKIPAPNSVFKRKFQLRGRALAQLRGNIPDIPFFFFGNFYSVIHNNSIKMFKNFRVGVFWKFNLILGQTVSTGSQYACYYSGRRLLSDYSNFVYLLCKMWPATQPEPTPVVQNHLYVICHFYVTVPFNLKDTSCIYPKLCSLRTRRCRNLDGQNINFFSVCR